MSYNEHVINPTIQEPEILNTNLMNNLIPIQTPTTAVNKQENGGIEEEEPVFLGFNLKNPQPPQTGFGLTPNRLIFDKSVSDFAKTLFPFLSSLCNNDKGYCNVTNKKLIEWFGVSRTKLLDAIKNLNANHYISVAVIRDKNNQVIERRIVTINPTGKTPTYPSFTNADPVVRNSGRRSSEMADVYINNIKINNKERKKRESAPEFSSLQADNPDYKLRTIYNKSFVRHNYCGPSNPSTSSQPPCPKGERSSDDELSRKDLLKVFEEDLWGNAITPKQGRSGSKKVAFERWCKITHDGQKNRQEVRDGWEKYVKHQNNYKYSIQRLQFFLNPQKELWLGEWEVEDRVLSDPISLKFEQTPAVWAQGLKRLGYIGEYERNKHAKCFDWTYATKAFKAACQKAIEEGCSFKEFINEDPMLLSKEEQERDHELNDLGKFGSPSTWFYPIRDMVVKFSTSMAQQLKHCEDWALAPKKFVEICLQKRAEGFIPFFSNRTYQWTLITEGQAKEIREEEKRREEKKRIDEVILEVNKNIDWEKVALQKFSQEEVDKGLTYHIKNETALWGNVQEAVRENQSRYFNELLSGVKQCLNGSKNDFLNNTHKTLRMYNKNNT